MHGFLRNLYFGWSFLTASNGKVYLFLDNGLIINNIYLFWIYKMSDRTEDDVKWKSNLWTEKIIWIGFANKNLLRSNSCASFAISIDWISQRKVQNKSIYMQRPNNPVEFVAQYLLKNNPETAKNEWIIYVILKFI